MKVCILIGSPRKDGNTYQLLQPFIAELAANGCMCEQVWLYDKKLNPCCACRTCQQDWETFGCPEQDDMQNIFDSILGCDLLVLASPIYVWYCTPPMKAVLDRMAYGMNKYYGDEQGPSLWRGKGVAILTTCGYRPENGADLWEMGVIRYCKHSQLNYLGMLAERARSYKETFMDPSKEQHSREFAAKLLAAMAHSDDPSL